MGCEPHWTAYVSAGLVPIVTILGLLIAYRQWRTAQNKLKLDLFDRRFAIYDTARSMLSSVAMSGRVTDQELLKYISGTREVKWLLNADIDEYLNRDLYTKAVHHQTTHSELEAAREGEERVQLARLKAKERQDLLQQLEVLDAKFKSFLQLEH